MPFFRRRPNPDAVAEPELKDKAVADALEADADPEVEGAPSPQDSAAGAVASHRDTGHTGRSEAQRVAEEKTEKALARTRRSWFGRITGILDRPRIDEDL